MKLLINAKPQSMVNAYMIFFIVHSVQVGVGVQGFQRVIFLDAKHDAWISVLLAGVAASLVSWVMVRTLSLYKSTDLYGIQYDLFGKWIGNGLNFIFILYFLGSFFVIIRNYIEVIQAWVFPDIPTWFIAITILLLVIYGISGGLRTIIGVSFFSIFISLWIIPMLAFPIQFADWNHLLPVYEASNKSILKGTHDMSFTIQGFEIVYLVYPFLKEKEKANKYVQLAILFSTFLYFSVMVISLAYFSGGQLERTIWGTLSLLKIVRLPFIERFEYVAVTYWVIIILPNLMLYLWAASRGLARIFDKKEKPFVWLFSIFLFFCLLIYLTRVEMNMINNYFSKYGFYLVFVYPIVLYLFALIKKKLFNKKEGAYEEVGN